jgi:hypothetical protein
MNIVAMILATELVASGHVGRTENHPVDVRPLHDKISVRMHQAVTFAFDERGGHLVSPRVVHGKQKQPTITLEVTDEIRGSSTLIITSTFPKMLQYRGAAHFSGKPAFQTTIPYPVHPNAPDAQGFPGSIDEFVLWDLRLTK